MATRRAFSPWQVGCGLRNFYRAGRRATLLAGAMGFLAATGCATSPAGHHELPFGAASAPGDAAHRDGAMLLIIKRGWHIDVGFAVTDLQPPLRVVGAQLPQARYLFFGFGDRRYLTARVKRLDALLAAARPGPALILLTGLQTTPQAAFHPQAVRALTLNSRQREGAEQLIWRTLAHPAGVPERVQPGPYGDSAYLAALPHYSALHTCNTWAAQVLRAAGLPVHTRGVVFAWQLWMQVLRLQRAERLQAKPPMAEGLGARSRPHSPDQLQGG